MRVRTGKKVQFIGCEIIHREACRLAAESPMCVDLRFIQKGLHDLPTEQMLATLQQEVDAVDDQHEAVLLGYARCNDGTVGLRARDVPLVVPKAHDCVTFFFGGRRAYKEYFDAHPGTYFHTTGWLERDDPNVPGRQGIMDQLGLNRSYEQLVEAYGEDNADYIQQTLGDTRKNYDRLCYLAMGACDETAFVEASRAEADRRGWTFDLRQGDWTLLRKLLLGPWDEDVLVVAPGGSIRASNDAEVLGGGE